MYYVNTRGIKSKLNSVERIAEELAPQVMCVTETMLDKDEKIEIPGYRVFDNNNKTGKGGIIIAVKKELKDITIETEQVTEEYQSLWIKIDNTRNKINVGCIYAPQENKTKVSTLNKMYAHIATHALKARQDNERVIITGDFNAKIGNAIQGNKEEVSKSGRLLLKTALEQELSILNTSQKCEGKWTRILGKERSVLDYIMVRMDDERYISKIKIDEEKEHTPGYKEGSQVTYSDHCAIIVEMQVTEANLEQHEINTSKVIAEESLNKISQMTEAGILTKIAKENTGLDEKYDKWMMELSRIIGQTAEVKRNKKKQTMKIVRKMNILKKKVRNKPNWNRRQKKNQIQNINSIIENEIKQQRARMTIRMAKDLQTENQMHSGTFYEFKRRMDRKAKGETPSSMMNADGKEVTTRDEIKEVFEKFYENLFNHDPPSSDIEKKAEVITERVFEDILKEAENGERKEQISAETIERSIKKSKNKGSMDYDNISNKIIKAAGKDLKDSIGIIFNEINNTNMGPEAWANMIIKSIYKGKKSKKEMNNRRGLFLTSVICKLFERTKLDKDRDIIESKLSKFQNGGVQGKSPIDNKMILNATVDYNNFINCETYVFFADAHKCFDKLDLKTCLIDLYEILGAQETKLMYELNKKARIVVRTPVGETKPVEVHEIVKQGTLYGPILCDINTDKVNMFGSKIVSTIGPNIKCEASIYVDDIEQAGSHINIIEGTARNCGTMEDIRKYTFNNEVDKTAFLIINPKKGSEKIQELENQVKRGKIKRTHEYKFVGEWYNEKGNHEKSIKAREEKAVGTIAQIKFYGDPYKVGNMALQVRIQIFQSTVIPTIYHDIEAWSKISKKDIENLDKIQRTVLTSIMELPNSTPYIGILSELGIWPVEQLVDYKRIMLLHQITKSKDTRFLKEIIEEQIRDTFSGCWYEQTKEICDKYNLGLQLIKCLSKTKLKNILKSRINKRLDMFIKKEAKTKTKLRFCSDFKRKKYTKKGNINFSDAKCIMKLRLNMTELRSNYKGSSESDICGLCKDKNDTTEHLFECAEIKKQLGNVPTAEIIRKDDDDSYEELAKFLKNAYAIREINSNKTVKENLVKIQKPVDIYTVKSTENHGMKIMLSKIKSYSVKNVSDNGMKIVLSKEN